MAGTSGNPYIYGNLGSVGARDYRGQRIQPQDAFTAQNWAGAAAASSSSKSALQQALVTSAGRMGEAGISATGQVASTALNGQAQLGAQGIASATDMAKAETAAQIAKRGLNQKLVGGLLGAGAGIYQAGEAAKFNREMLGYVKDALSNSPTAAATAVGQPAAGLLYQPQELMELTGTPYATNTDKMPVQWDTNFKIGDVPGLASMQETLKATQSPEAQAQWQATYSAPMNVIADPKALDAISEAIKKRQGNGTNQSN